MTSKVFDNPKPKTLAEEDKQPLGTSGDDGGVAPKVFHSPIPKSLAKEDTQPLGGSGDVGTSNTVGGVGSLSGDTEGNAGSVPGGNDVGKTRSRFCGCSLTQHEASIYPEYKNSLDLGVCANCNKSGHNKNTCPLNTSVCKNCNKRGHLINMCPYPEYVFQFKRTT